MSTINQVTGQGAAADAPPLSPTKTHYQQLADDFMKGFDALTATLPPVELKHPTNETFVKTHQNVPDDFVATVISAIEQSVELEGVKTFDATVGRDRKQYSDAMRPLAETIIRYGLSLIFTSDFKSALNAADALQMYAIAKSVARKADNAAVGLHVKSMKRDLGKRGRKKAKAKAPDTTPNPAPTTPNPVSTTPNPAPTPQQQQPVPHTTT